MSVESHLEVERKFDVGALSVVPSLLGLRGVATVSEPSLTTLDAVYYDTADLDLATAGITLRRRTGGEDAGWHLKVPVGDHEREELRLPAGERNSGVPAALLDRTRGVRRDATLVRVARVRTHRELRRLLDERGRVLAEFCDDRVTGDRFLPASRTRWREWEIELVEGRVALLEEGSELMLGSGAVVATAASKLARVLAVQPGDSDPDGGAGTAVAVMTAYLSEQVAQLRREEPLVRSGTPDSLHKMRVAARRARSALATYAPLLEPGAGAALQAELRWVGTVLGEARDAEVLRSRMEGLLADATGSTDAPSYGLVARTVAAELQARQAQGEIDAVDLLDSARYATLLGALEDFLMLPPVTPEGADRGVGEVARLVGRDWRRLRRRARVAAATPRGEEHDVALHDVRKAAKRLRYAATSASAVLGVRAEMLAESCATLQDLLGEHHDAAVLRALMARVRRDLAASDRPDLVLDRLRDQEEARATLIERDYEAAWRALRDDHPGSWLRRSARPTAPAPRRDPGS